MNKVLADKGSNHYRLCLDGKLPSDEGALEVAVAELDVGLPVQRCVLVAVLLLEQLEVFLLELWRDALIVRNVFVHLHHELVGAAVGRAASRAARGCPPPGVLRLLVDGHVVSEAAIVVAIGALQQLLG